MTDFTQTITLAELVAANRKAIEDDTLGALNNNNCQYRYMNAKGDPTGEACSIGVALNDKAHSKVRRLGYNSCGFELLVRTKVVEVVGHHNAYELALNMQRLHDAWAQGEGAMISVKDPLLIPQSINSFFDELMFGLGRPKEINQTIFMEYLDLIEAELANPTVTEGEAA